MPHTASQLSKEHPLMSFTNALHVALTALERQPIGEPEEQRLYHEAANVIRMSINKTVNDDELGHNPEITRIQHPRF
jgi:hypothetical protein